MQNITQRSVYESYHAQKKKNFVKLLFQKSKYLHRDSTLKILFMFPLRENNVLREGL